MKHILTGLAAVALLTGCGVETTNEVTLDTKPAAEGKTSALAAIVGKDVATTDAIAIPVLKPVAEIGASITIEGKIMGSDQPFVEGRAVMLVGDEATIESCDVLPDDPCKTPWDVCCVDPKTVLAGTATVQVVDDAGKPLAEGLKGVGGLTELSKVRVTGTVAPGSNKDVLVVNASAIQVL